MPLTLFCALRIDKRIVVGKGKPASVWLVVPTSKVYHGSSAFAVVAFDEQLVVKGFLR